MIADALELEEGYVLAMVHLIHENPNLTDMKLVRLFMNLNAYAVH